MTTMTKERIEQWWSENQEGLQEEVDELHTQASEGFVRSLDYAVSCESFNYFKANLDDAIEAAQALLNELKEIKDRVTF